MVKNVLKEIIIILLLTLAIILLLGVALYEYVPMNKVIPEKITYTASEEVKQISNEVTQKNEEIPITTYTVTSTDLTNYKRVKDYTAGRKNPFASVESTTEITENTISGTTSGTTGNTTNSNTTNGNTTSTNENSTNYYPDKGTK